MRNLTAAAALAALLALNAAAQIVVNADGTMPVDTNKNQSNPLAGQQKRLTLAVQAGAAEGFNAPTSIEIPTGAGGSIRINIGEHATAERAAPAVPKGRDPAPLIELFAVAMIVAAAIFMRDKSKAARPKIEEHPDEAPFAILRAIGEGGMGTVYEALDRKLDRHVAVKKLRTSGPNAGNALKLLIDEAKTVAALHHPNIVQIFSVVSQGGEAYIVFELIEGKTVEDYVANGQRLALKDVRAILEHVCIALEYAHEKGIIHRDLKPGNVMISPQGQVKVMDFGIARRMMSEGPIATSNVSPANILLTNTVQGTLPYLSPEGFSGVIQAQGDVYALGVMAYRMLSGIFPYPPNAEAIQKLEPYARKLTSMIPDLPPGIDALIDAALEPDAAKRLSTPKEFRERLSALR